mgnify:CR=1 FL=1
MIRAKGGYEKVDFWALDFSLINQLRELNAMLPAGTDFCIHCGVEGKHSATGYHPRGMAVDCHFEQNGELVQPDAMLFLLIKKWEGGIGIYTRWNNPGFHLDVGPTRTWWKNDSDDQYHSLAEYVKEKGLNEYYSKIV